MVAIMMLLLLLAAQQGPSNRCKPGGGAADLIKTKALLDNAPAVTFEMTDKCCSCFSCELPMLLLEGLGSSPSPLKCYLPIQPRQNQHAS
jgi:hypothetical protein